jgi:hypothetical protein
LNNSALIDDGNSHRARKSRAANATLTAIRAKEAERVVAIVTVTGRFIGPLSRHPDNSEVALLPATLLAPVGSVAVSGIDHDVVLLAETGTAPGLPADLPELKQTIGEQVGAALLREPITVH